jgi:chromosome segregation ATPase
LTPEQALYCGRCLENVGVELELKLRELGRQCNTLERKLATSQATEIGQHESLSQLQHVASEKQAEVGTSGKELEQLRLSNEELRTRLKEVQDHELDLTESLREREHQIGELAAELDTVLK